MLPVLVLQIELMAGWSSRSLVYTEKQYISVSLVQHSSERVHDTVVVSRTGTHPVQFR